MKVGDHVAWKIQGYTKRGVIVAVIPSNTLPSDIVPDLALRLIHLGFKTRNHESYLVQIANTSYLRWPIQALKKIEKEFKVGDHVVWFSQGLGSSKKKVGSSSQSFPQLFQCTK